ncbi:hypothetical protein ACFS4T_33970 [Pseudomonas lini]
MPFDPLLYPEVNNPELGDEQEHPAKLHFLDDRKQVKKLGHAGIYHPSRRIDINQRARNQ